MDFSKLNGISVKVDDSCPIATQDISVNLKNRQKAIDSAGYGPLNPKKPNNEFWNAKAERWDTTPKDAKGQRCGNCAAFIKTSRMLDCIDKGLGNESGNSAWDVIDAGDLGYCEAFDFKCASSRTCDAWIVGGPITEEKENNMEEKSLEEMFNELLAIEEKVAPIVPVLPAARASSLNPSNRVRSTDRNMNRYSFGYNKAEEEDMPEDDMYYDDEYSDDEYMDGQEMDKELGNSGRARPNPGSPVAASERNRRQNFSNWINGRNPQGGTDYPASHGPLNIGEAGARQLGQNRGRDLMRMQSWTNPRPRPRVRPERGPGRPAPAPKPKAQAPKPHPPFNPPSFDHSPSDNAAQQISGGIPIKSAWDREVYNNYGFESKKLPMTGGGSMRPKPNTRSADASVGAMGASQARGLRAAGQHFSGQSGSRASADTMEARGKNRVRQLGAQAIGAAGPMSSTPVGDKRTPSVRPERKPGWNGRVPYKGQRPGPLPQRERIVKKPREGFAPNRPERKPGWDGTVPYSGGNPTRPRSSNLPQTRRSNGIDKPLQSLAGFSGKSFDYEYDYVDDFIDQKGVPYSSTRRNDLKYGPWEQVGNPGAGVMGRRAVSAISSDAMPGMRFRKASDEDMYWDDEDEVAIEPDAESKVDMTPEQAAGLRAAGEYFSGRSGSRASADTMEARGRNRIRQFRNWQGSEGRRPANKPTAPKPASSTLSSVTKRPSGVGGSADTMSRQIANRPNRPNTRFSNSSGNNRQRTWSGSPGGNAPRPRPAVKPPTKPSSSGGRSLGEKLTYIPSKLWHELGPHL